MATNPCGPGDDGTCVCRHLCGGAWPEGDATTTLTWPVGASGSTEAGLVPLGPRLELVLGRGGEALRCGLVTPPAEAPVCAAASSYR